MEADEESVRPPSSKRKLVTALVLVAIVVIVLAGVAVALVVALTQKTSTTDSQIVNSKVVTIGLCVSSPPATARRKREAVDESLCSLEYNKNLSISVVTNIADDMPIHYRILSFDTDNTLSDFYTKDEAIAALQGLSAEVTKTAVNQTQAAWAYMNNPVSNSQNQFLYFVPCQVVMQLTDEADNLGFSSAITGSNSIIVSAAVDKDNITETYHMGQDQNATAIGSDSSDITGAIINQILPPTTTTAASTTAMGTTPGSTTISRDDDRDNVFNAADIHSYSVYFQFRTDHCSDYSSYNHANWKFLNFSYDHNNSTNDKFPFYEWHYSGYFHIYTEHNSRLFFIRFHNCLQYSSTVPPTTTSSPSTAIPTTTTFGTTVPSTTAAKIPINCVFFLDWNYLGDPGDSPNNFDNYIAERDYIDRVTSALFTNPQVVFAAIEGQFGFVDDVIDSQEPLFTDYSNFHNLYQNNDPSSKGVDLSYCQALDKINPYVLPASEGKCMVFLSGQTSNTLSSCGKSLDISQYSILVAGNLNGRDFSSVIPNTIDITDYSSQTDIDNMVNAILNAAMNPITPGTKGSTTQGTTPVGTTATTLPTVATATSSQGTTPSSTSPANAITTQPSSSTVVTATSTAAASTASSTTAGSTTSSTSAGTSIASSQGTVSSSSTPGSTTSARTTASLPSTTSGTSTSSGTTASSASSTGSTTAGTTPGSTTSAGTTASLSSTPSGASTTAGTPTSTASSAGSTTIGTTPGPVTTIITTANTGTTVTAASTTSGSTMSTAAPTESTASSGSTNVVSTTASTTPPTGTTGSSTSGGTTLETSSSSGTSTAGTTSLPPASTVSTSLGTTVTTTMTTTTAQTVPLNCVFFLDWDYLGDPVDPNPYNIYPKQRDYVGSVVQALFNYSDFTQEITFAAVEGQFGYISGPVIDPNQQLFKDFDSFNQKYGSVTPKAGQPERADYCNAVNGDINSYLLPADDGKCMVFLSGQLPANLDCATLDTSQYSILVGGNLNGRNFSSVISNTVDITSQFSQQDVDKMVAAILNAALASPTTGGSTTRRSTASPSSTISTTPGSTQSPGTTVSTQSPGTTVSSPSSSAISSTTAGTTASLPSSTSGASTTAGTTASTTVFTGSTTIGTTPAPVTTMSTTPYTGTTVTATSTTPGPTLSTILFTGSTGASTTAGSTVTPGSTTPFTGTTPAFTGTTASPVSTAGTTPQATGSTIAYTGTTASSTAGTTVSTSQPTGSTAFTGTSTVASTVPSTLFTGSTTAYTGTTASPSTAGSTVSTSPFTGSTTTYTGTTATATNIASSTMTTTPFIGSTTPYTGTTTSPTSIVLTTSFTGSTTAYTGTTATATSTLSVASSTGSTNSVTTATGTTGTVPSMTAGSTVSTTPGPLVSLACAFVKDWDYLGPPGPQGDTAYDQYTQQSQFIQNVVVNLFNNSGITFAAAAGQYGYAPGGHFLDQSLSSNYVDYLLANMNVLPSSSETQYCQCTEDFNDYYDYFVNGHGYQKTCLVFLYGQSDVPNCTLDFDYSPYSFTIGVGLNGSLVNPVSDDPLEITNFDPADVQSLVNAILNKALQP